jgi:2-hydroxy-3-oxopropionate reductase
LIKIGFIGLGVMGKPMAKNLLKAGYPLVIYDIVQETLSELIKSGAEAASNPKEVAVKSDIIITMLPDSPQVEEVMLRENGILEGARKGCLVIDMSSIDPQATVRLHTEAKRRGVRMMDAPVSGGQPGAIAGSLAIMVGGDQKDFEEAKDILQVMGKSVVRIGEIGAGQYTKLVNQILVGIHIQAMSEALVLAKKAGLDVQKVYDAIKGGLAGSNVLNAKVPLVLQGSFKPGFRINLHIKDLKNALTAGREIGAPLPLTALVQQFFEACEAAGRGNLDHAALITVMEDLAKVQVRTT